jgi:hypothetical protein
VGVPFESPSTRTVAILGMLLTPLFVLSAGCRDKNKAKAAECDRLEVFFDGSPKPSCPIEQGPTTKPDRKEASYALDRRIAALAQLHLDDPDVQRMRAELVRYAGEEARLCRELDAAQDDPAKRTELAAALQKNATSRRGHFEGAKFSCDEAQHPPHFP